MPSKAYLHPEERPTGGSRRTQDRDAALRLNSCPASQRIRQIGARHRRITPGFPPGSSALRLLLRSLAAWLARAGYDTVPRARTPAIVMLARVFGVSASAHPPCRKCTPAETNPESFRH